MNAFYSRAVGSRPFLIACGGFLAMALLLWKDPFPCEPHLKNSYYALEGREVAIECPEVGDKQCPDRTSVEILDKSVERECPVCASQTPAPTIVHVQSQTAAASAVTCASQTPGSTPVVCS